MMFADGIADPAKKSKSQKQFGKPSYDCMEQKSSQGGRISLHASKSITIKVLMGNPRSDDANVLGGGVFLP